MGQKHIKRFQEFRMPLFPRDIQEKPRIMQASVPQAMAQFVLKTEKLSHIMGTTEILEMARLRSPCLIMASGRQSFLILRCTGNGTLIFIKFGEIVKKF